jgi:hypothetical protein
LRFTCQHLPEIDDVSEDFIERAFDQKALGGFAVWKLDPAHLPVEVRAVDWWIAAEE